MKRAGPVDPLEDVVVVGFVLLITDRVLFVATLKCCSTWYCGVEAAGLDQEVW